MTPPPVRRSTFHLGLGNVKPSFWGWGRTQTTEGVLKNFNVNQDVKKH